MNFNKYFHEAFIGLILGDGHLCKRSLKSNVYFTITLAEKYILLAHFIQNIFKDFMTPKGFREYKVQSSKGSKYFGRFVITTKSFSSFNSYHDMFYTAQTNNLNKYIKILFFNIEELLTPVVLAFFIMGDGN